MIDLTWLSKVIRIIIRLQVKESQTLLVINYFQFQGQKYVSQREIKIWGTDKEVLAENEKQKVSDNQRIICAVCWSYWKPNYCYCIPSISVNVIFCERRAAFSVELLYAPASKGNEMKHRVIKEGIRPYLLPKNLPCDVLKTTEADVLCQCFQVKAKRSSLSHYTNFSSINGALQSTFCLSLSAS